MVSEKQFMRIVYNDIMLSQNEIKHLRGFFADQDKGADYIHNHQKAGDVLYRYPRVQYKLINNHPAILAYENGIDQIYPLVLKNDKIHLGDSDFEVKDLDINLSTREIGDLDICRKYEFLSPWLALNQKNYKEYIRFENEDKEAFLKKIFVGNLLSMFKGFNIFIENNMIVDLNLKSDVVIYKSKKMIGFKGTFSTNALIPDYLGIGKGVSLGFGTVKSVT